MVQQAEDQVALDAEDTLSELLGFPRPSGGEVDELALLRSLAALDKVLGS